jgi:hypothetical protein
MFYRLLGIAARGINTPKSWDLLTLDLVSVSDSNCKATVSSFQDSHETVPSRRYRNPNKPKYGDVKEESGEEGLGIKSPGYRYGSGSRGTHQAMAKRHGVVCDRGMQCTIWGLTLCEAGH